MGDQGKKNKKKNTLSCMVTDMQIHKMVQDELAGDPVKTLDHLIESLVLVSNGGTKLCSGVGLISELWLIHFEALFSLHKCQDHTVLHTPSATSVNLSLSASHAVVSSHATWHAVTLEPVLRKQITK